MDDEYDIRSRRAAAGAKWLAPQGPPRTAGLELRCAR